MSYMSRRRLPFLIFSVIVLLAAVGLRIVDLWPLQQLRWAYFDSMQRIQPRAPVPSDVNPVVVIKIDEATMNAIGSYPIPRAKIANVIDALRTAGASVVTLDIVFAELRESVGDELLADALRRGPSVIGMGVYSKEVETTPRQIDLQKVVSVLSKPPGLSPENFMGTVPYLVRNVPLFENASVGHGIFNFGVFRDGVVRSIPSGFIHAQYIYPSLAVETLRLYADKKTVLYRLNKGGFNRVTFDSSLSTPTDREGAMWLHFAPEGSQLTISFKDVLSGKFDNNLVNGRIALISADAVGVSKSHVTPLGNSMTSGDFQAQLIEQIIHGATLHRPSYAMAVEIIIILISVIVVTVGLTFLLLRHALLMSVITVAIIIGGTWYAFSGAKILLDGTLPLITLLVLMFVRAMHIATAKDKAIYQ